MTIQRGITQATQSSTLADLLERILDKGIVIAGDIRINLVEVELLTIQIRLVICSVDKAKEMGMDWWVNNPAFSPHARPELNGDHLGELDKRLAALEAASTRGPASVSREVGPATQGEREPGAEHEEVLGEAAEERRRLEAARRARDEARVVLKARRVPKAKRRHRGR